MSKSSSYFLLTNLKDKKDAEKIKTYIGKIPGVLSVSVNPENSRLAVDYDDTGVSFENISKTIKQLGYDIKSDKNEEHIM